MLPYRQRVFFLPISSAELCTILHQRLQHPSFSCPLRFPQADLGPCVGFSNLMSIPGPLLRDHKARRRYLRATTRAPESHVMHWVLELPSLPSHR